MGVDADRSLRVSVGWSTTDADVDAFLDAFPVVVGLLRPSRSLRRVSCATMTTHGLVLTSRPSSPPPSTSATPPLAITFSDAPPDGVAAVRRADARRRCPTAAPAACPPGACSG